MSERAPLRTYLHITGIPALRLVGDEAAVHLDASWHRDISHHTYLCDRVVVLCPITTVTSVPANHVRFADERFEFVALPSATSTARYLASGRFIAVAARIWTELGHADLVFAGLVEHPLPLGWFAFPMARIRGVEAYTFLESAPWRLTPGVESSGRVRFRSAVTTRINSLMLRLLEFAAMTQPAYGDLLPGRCPRVLTPASWFLPEERAEASRIDEIDARVAGESGPDGTTHLLFVGRLDPAKGLRQLMSALDTLERSGTKLRFTVLGDGPMGAEIDQHAARMQHVALSRRGWVRYGPEFFGVLHDVDAVVVPSLSDEQPRIVFDAASQAVPVIASDTTGLRSVIDDAITGLLFTAGDVAALAQVLAATADQDGRRRLQGLGRRAYETTGTYDHLAMHQRRSEFIAGLMRPAGAVSGPGGRR